MSNDYPDDYYPDDASRRVRYVVQKEFTDERGRKWEVNTRYTELETIVLEEALREGRVKRIVTR